MQLVYQVGWDFWQFYKANVEDIEVILNRICRKYQHKYDPQDMHSELLVRLHKSDFLKRFDPSRSQLNTYLTRQVWGTASHIVEEMERQTRVIKIKDDEGAIQWEHLRQKFFASINGGITEDGALNDIESEEDFTDKVERTDLIEKIHNKLPNVCQYREIFVKRLLGLGFVEIAEGYGVSDMCIVRRCEKIARYAARILKQDQIRKTANV